jgi:hypothetical protein
LRHNALGPYRDTTVPRVDAVRLVRRERPLDLAHVAGTVALVADVYDTVPLPVRPPWSRLPVTPATLRWRVLSERGVAVLGSAVYARGTHQNRADCPGRYCVILAHS